VVSEVDVFVVDPGVPAGGGVLGVASGDSGEHFSEFSECLLELVSAASSCGEARHLPRTLRLDGRISQGWYGGTTPAQRSEFSGECSGMGLSSDPEKKARQLENLRRGRESARTGARKSARESSGRPRTVRAGEPPRTPPKTPRKARDAPSDTERTGGGLGGFFRGLLDL
jgi:hypothetical protein